MRPIFSNLSIRAACDFTESNIRVLQALSDGRVISAVSVPADGLQNGRIHRIDRFAEAIWQAASRAEAQSGHEIKSLSVSMDDCRLQSQKIRGSSHTDIGSEGFEKKHLKEAEVHALQALAPSDMTLVYQKEAGYLVDRKDYIHNPIGICGHELTVVLYLLFSEPAYAQNIQFAVERTGRSLKGLYPSGLAYRRGTRGHSSDESRDAVCVLNMTNAHFGVFQNDAIQSYQSLVYECAEPAGIIDRISEKINLLFEGTEHVGIIGELADRPDTLSLIQQKTDLPCALLKPAYLSSQKIPASFAGAYGATLLDGMHHRPRIAEISSRIKKSVSDKTRQFIYEYFG